MQRLFDIAVPVPFFPWNTLFSYKEFEGEIETKPGQLVEVSFGRRKVRGVVVRETQKAPDPKIKIKSIHQICIEEPVFSAERLAFVESLGKHYRHPIGLVFEASLPSSIRNGTERTLKHTWPISMEAPNVLTSPFELNEDQEKSFQNIMNGNKDHHLLWGITGSGKTEVYLRCVEEALKRNQTCLVLVPEIALTPQLTERFEARFPGELATFHSAQTPKKTREAWFKVWTGRARVAIGARSALFAPLKNIGLIIVDEEHDGSYKQEEGFRYHAAEAARLLSVQTNARLVLGSATPRAESIALVETGELELNKLSRRASSGSKLPKLHVVDLKKGLAKENKIPHVEIKDEFDLPKIDGDFFLSPELRVSLDRTLDKKEQAILFVNRRGVGSQFICKTCGESCVCPNCDVRLTPHSQKLLCHYCAYEIAIPSKCDSCGSKDEPFTRVGVGTEGLEKILAFHYPDAKVLRLDRDTVQKKDDLEKILTAFSNKEADILVGTQMVAKGHDFPSVSLVGILLADLGLSVPDFRASERTLQLLMQVAGRAGRADIAGEVIIQSFQPENPIFASLLSPDPMTSYFAFLKEELAKREVLRYAPYSRMALLRFDSLENNLAHQASRYVCDALSKINSDKLQVLGPVVSPMAKLRGRYRTQILLKCSHSESFDTALDWILQGWNKGGLEKRFKTRMLVDVDPQSM